MSFLPLHYRIMILGFEKEFGHDFILQETNLKV